MPPADWFSTADSTGHRRPRLVMFTGVGVLAVVVAAVIAWLATQPAATTTAPQLSITSVYAPPTTADPTEVYFTVTNTGSAADTLISAGADYRTATAAHTLTICTGPTCTAHPVSIPAHGTVAFTATGPHLRLTGLGPLPKGHPPLQLTLTFAHSGTTHILAPIGTPADLTNNDVMTYGFMGAKDPGMDMPGMSAGSDTTTPTAQPVTPAPTTMPGMP